MLMIREETGQSSQHLSQWADILMMMFGYSSVSSLNSLVEMYQQFREHRLECSDMLIVLVGVVGKCCLYCNMHMTMYPVHLLRAAIGLSRLRETIFMKYAN